MSQKVSPILFNNSIYNNSKWFSKKNNKFLLNEDLQIRELINIIFKNSLNSQFLFIDKIIFYKYNTSIKIYIYYFCNFYYLKRNIVDTVNCEKKNINYLNIYYLYYKYFEILNIKKLEILKILASLKYNLDNIYIYLKNINSYVNNNSFILANLSNRIQGNFMYKKYKSYIKNLNKNYRHIILNKKNMYFNNTNINYIKYSNLLKKRYSSLKYYKTIHFILYSLCYNNQYINKLTARNLINIIYHELNSIDVASKNYNFIFYNIFNILKDYLTVYIKDSKSNIRGIKIQIKGRYLLTKRKRIFIFNFGKLNLNKICLNKDYYCLNLVKSTGVSSIKIWIIYKN